MDYKSFSPNDESPLHVQISTWILEQIADYSLDDQLPTDRKLAAGLKVSTLTVQRAMSELEREGYVQRVQGRGTFLQSRDRQVHGLQNSRAKGEIILAYPNYFSYDYWARAHLAELAALKAGYGMVEFKINPSTTHHALIDLVKRCENPQAVLMSPVPGLVDLDFFNALDGLGLPVILFAHCDHLSLGSNIYSVVPDWYKSGYLRTKLLLDQGHTDIAWVCNEPAGQDNGEALRGSRQCMRDHGLSIRNLRLARGTTKSWEDSTEAAYKLCCDVVENFENVTALIVNSIAGAVGSQHCLWKRGLSVPEDMSIISGGGGMPIMRFLSPRITAITTSYDDEIAKAFSILESPPQGNRALVSEVIKEAGDSIAPPRFMQQKSAKKQKGDALCMQTV